MHRKSKELYKYAYGNIGKPVSVSNRLGKELWVSAAELWVGAQTVHEGVGEASHRLRGITHIALCN